MCDERMCRFFFFIEGLERLFGIFRVVNAFEGGV